MLPIGNVHATMILLLIGNKTFTAKQKTLMPKNFLANPPATDTATATLPVAEPPQLEREPVKILLIGSPKAVRSIIHILYRLGFASVSEWSPLQPTQKLGEVMSILLRYLRL